jgi:hypothetical protein
MPLRIVAPDGLVRHAHVVLPRNWHELAPMPVVLGYTGGGANAFALAAVSRLHEVCFSGRDEDQFVTVYLEPCSWRGRRRKLVGRVRRRRRAAVRARRRGFTTTLLIGCSVDELRARQRRGRPGSTR